jgi:tRNA threonylcarbamoyladenosine biosynthesis protein TsaB
MWMNMKLLAIDTSASACSVALLSNDKMMAKHALIPLQQAQQILGMIDELLNDNNTDVNELSALAFGCGPGSFTGVRIAASVIQGLAYATQLPIISVSSLAAAAQDAYENLHWPKILVAMDARMQEVYYGAYQVNAQGLMELQGQEVVCAPDKIPLPEDNDWYAVGNGWQVYQSSLTYQPLALESEYMPTAFGVCLLAKAKFLAQDWQPAEEAIPVYLRDDVAQKSR